MRGYAGITLIGNLGQDPIFRVSSNGMMVANFSLAVNHTSKKNGDTVNWYRVSAFGQLAGVIKDYLRKGSPVLVAGNLVISQYTDRNGGERMSFDVTANNISFLGGNSQYSGDDDDSVHDDTDDTDDAKEDADDKDIPF